MLLEPLTDAEFDAWAEHSRQGFAAQQVAAGLQPEAEAREAAQRGFAALLPDGLATPTHHVFRVVCPEGGTVGHLWVRVRELSSEVEGYVYDVELLPEARGRGLGRATMLAAEEVARTFGVTVMRLNVFGHNTAARRLYESLGYVVTSATMTKRLDGPDEEAAPGGPDLRLRAMTAAELAEVRPRLQSELAANIVRSGTLPRAEAVRKAAADLEHLLPEGHATPGHLLWTGEVDGRPVGEVWLQLRDRSDGTHAFGFDLHVHPRLRGRGYGRALVRAAQREARERGVRSVALSVFGFSTTARRLYASDGFVVTAQTMAKQL